MMRSNEPPAIPEESIESKKRWHRAQAVAPLREKVRILLELQRHDLPLIQRRRALRDWETPWPIEP